MECSACARKTTVHWCRSCCTEEVRNLQQEIVSTCKSPAVSKVTRQLSVLLEAQIRKERLDSLIWNFEKTILHYKDKVAPANMALSLERKRVQTKRAALQQRKTELAAAKRRLEHLKRLMIGESGVEKPVLMGLSIQLETLQDAVARDRRKRVMQLLELFPICSPERPGPEGVGSIANLVFPTSLQSLEQLKHDERVAAVSTIVRVLMIASIYLCLPLPFSMKATGTKALIRHGDVEHDLTEPGESLRKGMTLLNLNVEFLCYSQGVPPEQVLAGELLHNLWQVFHSPSLGRSVFRSLHDADGRIGRAPRGYHMRVSTKPSADGEAFLEVEAPSTRLTKESEWDLITTPRPPEPYKTEDLRLWEDSLAERQ